MSYKMAHLVWIGAFPTSKMKARISVVVHGDWRSTARRRSQREEAHERERGSVAEIHRHSASRSAVRGTNGHFARAHSTKTAVCAGTALNPCDACATGISTHGIVFDFQNRDRGTQGLWLACDFLLNEDFSSVRKVHLFDPIFVSVHISYDGIVGTNYLENWKNTAVCFLDEMLGFPDDTSRTDLESTGNKTEAAVLHSRERDSQKPILRFVQIGESLSSEYPPSVLAHLNYHRKSFGLKIIGLNKQSALKITRFKSELAYVEMSIAIAHYAVNGEGASSRREHLARWVLRNVNLLPVTAPLSHFTVSSQNNPMVLMVN
jgi:hypothetical protein